MDVQKPQHLSTRFLVRAAALGLTLVFAAGCGDSPSRDAGTIDLPDRKPTERVTAKNWTKAGKTPKPSQR